MTIVMIYLIVALIFTVIGFIDIFKLSRVKDRDTIDWFYYKCMIVLVIVMWVFFFHG